MIYTVTFNPSLDYIITTDNLTVGEINRVTSELILSGGKGINVSTVLNHLGVENTALGFVAGFTGNEIENGFLKSCGKCVFIHLEKGLSSINV